MPFDLSLPFEQTPRLHYIFTKVSLLYRPCMTFPATRPGL